MYKNEHVYNIKCAVQFFRLLEERKKDIKVRDFFEIVTTFLN